ncbi:MAG: hypothetical protein SGI77_16005 [Pirellulaceae bacterium]|nr:hypothetical protein [Pirellulaceae bacterium]
MHWDPEVESPATVAVIGTGPVGIEAALYARFLGYEIDLYDAGRPACHATRWHQRSLAVAVRDCTTSLGHAALLSQDANYQRPNAERIFTGQQFADEYLTPLAKSDLLSDGVHINSEVIEVSRLRTSLEDQDDLQDRCNDEFRLLVHSRDRGFYTSRADIVLDCRGAMYGECGWGPAGSQSIGANEVSKHLHSWLPRDPRFELKSVQNKQTILFGTSDRARLFAEEWSEFVENDASPSVQEALRRMAPAPTASSNISGPALAAVSNVSGSAIADGSDNNALQLNLKLIWLLPSMSPVADAKATKIAADLTARHSDPRRFSVLPIRGIERIARSEEGIWTLTLLLSDDSTVDLVGDVFAPFPNARSTSMLGKELRSQEYAFQLPMASEFDRNQPLFYTDWPGWQVATHEPHYYRLGSIDRPSNPTGLPDAFRQIRDLFALLGTRENMNLYDIVESR